MNKKQALKLKPGALVELSFMDGPCYAVLLEKFSREANVKDSRFLLENGYSMYVNYDQINFLVKKSVF